MKTLFALLLTISTHSLLAACESSKQFIFLIHGIGGDKTTFGAMDEYLEKQSDCFKVQTFLYDTGNSTLSTKDFANHLDAFIEKNLKKDAATENDRISLIMHSQGGLVGSLWLNKVRTEKENIFKQVDSFITLSTPYWGADIAEWARNFFYTLPEGAKNPISPFGRKELNEMTYGSDTIQELQMNYTQVFNSHIRALAIGAIKREYGAYLGEDDGAVPIYSSRADHFFLDTEIDLKEKEGSIEVPFIKTNYAPFVVVKAMHSALDLPGVADIPKKCLKKKGCKHPSIDHILAHLNNETQPESVSPFFQRFRITLYVNGLEKMGLTEDDVTLELDQAKPEVFIPFIDKHIIRLEGKAKNQKDLMAFSFSGISVNENVNTLPVKLKINDAYRVIQIQVQGAHSTFLNVDLK